MYIGLLLQPLEDQFLVGLLRGRRRSACDKRKLFRLLERKCYLFDRGIRVCIRNLRVSAAAPEQGQCQYEGQTQPGQSLDFIFQSILSLLTFYRTYHDSFVKILLEERIHDQKRKARYNDRRVFQSSATFAISAVLWISAIIPG